MCFRPSMTTSLLATTLILLSGCTPVEQAPPISTEELCQLGAYISIAVVSADADGGGGGGGSGLKVGDVCPECRGVGEVGDGVVMMKCERCNGTGKVQPNDPDLAAEFRSQRYCLCLDKCKCDGKCDPCNCIFCLPKKPDISETVRR